MLLAFAGSASASQVLGTPFQNPGLEGYPGTLVQMESPNGEYAAPGDGVIVSWSKFANFGSDQQLKLKVARLAAPGKYVVVGESALETLPANSKRNTFLTRISVKKGDVIGLYSAAGGPIAVKELNEPWKAAGNAGDVLPGSSTFLELERFSIIAVDALWEADADADGFGDESQDKCPGTAGPESGCVPAPPVVTPPAETPKPPTGKGKKAGCKKGTKKVTVKGKGKAKGKTVCKPVKKGKAKAKGKGGK